MIRELSPSALEQEPSLGGQMIRFLSLFCWRMSVVIATIGPHYQFTGSMRLQAAGVFKFLCVASGVLRSNYFLRAGMRAHGFHEHTLKSFKSSLVIPCPMGPSTFLRNHRPVIAALLACRADASGTVFANCFCFWFVMFLDSMLPCLRPYHRHIQNSTFERRGGRSF